jgi:5-formyltetrahydrofolate cyclo-ligase|tara:strand:- start:222 stop:785 length:564 start_codon:yes stop_codon:yes gene_type:complete
VLKEDLRALYKKKRNSLDQKKSQDLSFEIANRSLQLNIWNNENYHIFFPIEKQNEIDTKLIIQIIQGKDKNVILPKVNLEENTMTNYLLTDSTLLKVNKLGVSEPISGIEIKPVQLEVVFIPLLSFDKSGHRVGYGGGYYDRLLKKCSRNCIKIGLSFFDPEDRIEDITQSDIKMNHCITPSKTYTF